MLKNADFKYGAEHWMMQSDPPSVSKVNLSGTDTAPPGVPGKVAHLEVTTLGEHNWNVQFYQSGLDLEDGEPYTLSFWARADRQRPLGVNIALDVPDWHTVGLAVNRVPLSRNWHKFAFVFTAARTLKDHGRLGFVLGDSLGIVDLAGISLRQAAVGTASGPNLLDDADLTNSTEDWSLQQSSSASAKLSWLGTDAAPPGVPGRVAHLEVTTLGEHNWNIQFVDSGLDLEDGEPYTLSFWARADRQRPLGVNIALDVPDWHAVGLDYQTTLTPMWRKVSLVFTAIQTVKDHNRLSFVLGDAPGTVDLVGMSLQHNVEGAPPQKAEAPHASSAASHSLVGAWETRSEDASRRFLLVFNADGTGSIRSDGAASEVPPQTPVSNAFRWYLQEGGRHLVVGTKVYTWSIRSSGKDVMLTLTDRKGKDHLFYRR